MKSLSFSQLLIRGRSLLDQLRNLRALKVSKRSAITICIGASIIPLCCVQQLFSESRVVDGFIMTSNPMAERYYVYYLSRSLAWVLISIVAVRMAKNKAERIFYKMFLAYNIYGFMLFFINYNSVNYYYLPLLIIAFVCNKVYS